MIGKGGAGEVFQGGPIAILRNFRGALIDETAGTALGVDVKAEAYEGLLDKAASEGKKGAGQYFTPRVLIHSIVHCMKPDPRVRPSKRSRA